MIAGVFIEKGSSNGDGSPCSTSSRILTGLGTVKRTFVLLVRQKKNILGIHIRLQRLKIKPKRRQDDRGAT